MLSRVVRKLKEKIVIISIILLATCALVYFYVINLQESFVKMQMIQERCMSELTSVKYQLNVVTEYKNRIDKLLTESQKSHKADKDIFKDMIESCVAMKQQSVICQSQFEDLQSVCKKVREDYNKLKELEIYKQTKHISAN